MLTNEKIKEYIKDGTTSDWKDEKSYKKFKTNTNIKPKSSKYTLVFYEQYPGARSLQQKANVTGIPIDILKKVYDKGLAAWRTGHRPGASQQAWGYARVHSFIMLGCTAFTSDKLLMENAISRMKPKDINIWKSKTRLCKK